MESVLTRTANAHHTRAMQEWFESPEWVWQIIAVVTSTLSALVIAIWSAQHFAKSKGAKSEGKSVAQAQFFWAISVLAVVIVIAQAMALTSHHSYNSDLVLHFDEKFDRMKDDRALAASAIRDYLQNGSWDAVDDTKADALEDVFAFFQELGFHWKHGQIGAAVLYEYFYDYMRVYCQETRGYIEQQQKEDSPAVWEDVLPLFEKLTLIEAERAHRPPAECKMDRSALDESLKTEIRLSGKR